MIRNFLPSLILNLRMGLLLNPFVQWNTGRQHIQRAHGPSMTRFRRLGLSRELSNNRWSQFPRMMRLLPRMPSSRPRRMTTDRQAMWGVIPNLLRFRPCLLLRTLKTRPFHGPILSRVRLKQRILPPLHGPTQVLTFFLPRVWGCLPSTFHLRRHTTMVLFHLPRVRRCRLFRPWRLLALQPHHQGLPLLSPYPVSGNILPSRPGTVRTKHGSPRR